MFSGLQIAAVTGFRAGFAFSGGVMEFKYIRIQGQELAENTMYPKGIFSMCWQMIQNDVMDQEDADLYKEIDG